MAGTLFVVATPIGNLEDITVRALRVLREVSVIAAEDTRRTAHLLTRYGITTSTTSLHEHNEHQKSAAVIAKLQSGESVAVVSDAGTPTIADPGGHLIAEAVAAGIRVEAIPGPNAAVAALSISGLRGDGSFLFLGFAPTKAKDRNVWLIRLAEAGTTVVFYEAPHRIVRTLEDILESVGDLHVVVGRELTKVHEELVRGPISAVLQANLKTKGEFTVVANVGHKPNAAFEDDSVSTRGDRAASEFGELTKQGAASRRQAITAVARKYGLTARQAYQAVEAAKKSGS